jgi:hypothetical protein
MRNRAPSLCIAAILLGVPVLSAAFDRFITYSGTALDVKDAAFLYRETHWLRIQDGEVVERVVLYTCRGGTPFAHKIVTYQNRFAPDFLFEDASNGVRLGLRGHDERREVFYRDDGRSAEKQSELPATDLVADSGFDAFVRTHWSELMDRGVVSMKFLVPSRLEEMSFKVQHLRSDRIDGAPVEVFRLKLSGALGWVVPSIDVYYGASDHVLLRYVGLSDLRGASRDNYVAAIDFKPNDRKSTDEASMNVARKARLEPCR